MEYYKSEVKSGCFILLAIIILAAMLFYLGGGQKYVGATTTYIGRFTNVSQIRNNSTVFMYGKAIGRVSDTRVRNEYAEVATELRSDLKVYENAKFVAKQVNVLGQLFLFLQPGSSEDGENMLISESPDDSPDVILAKQRKRMALPGKLGTSIEAIMKNAQGLTEQLNKTLESFNAKQEQLWDSIIELTTQFGELTLKINENFDDNKNNIAATLENVQGITLELKEFVKSNRAQIDEMLENTNKTMKTTQEQMEKNGESLNRLLETLQKQMEERVDVLLENLAKLTGDLDETVVNNQRSIYGTLKNIKDVTKNLNILILKLSSDPSQLIFGSSDETTDYEKEAKRSRQFRDKGRMPAFGHRD